MTSTTTQLAVTLSTQISPAFPPGFGTGFWAGVFYAQALASVMVAIALSTSMVIRFSHLNRIQGCAFDSPVASQRRIVSTFALALALAAIPNMLQWLLWGKIDPHTMSLIVRLHKVDWSLAGPIAFLGVNHGWVTWAIRRVRGAGIGPAMRIQSVEDLMTSMQSPSVFHDFRTAWPSPLIAARIVATCLVCAYLSAFLSWFMITR